MSIAEQMGVTLQATADSVNIKERLDFSCAIFDAEGALVANAPHLPVHLGSMDKSVESVIGQREGKFAAGDVFVINAPYHGGTHLPDITVVTPVFDRGGEKLLFFVASRGHHADIGGLTPGSASPDATRVDQEGVLIECFQMVDRGRFREQALWDLLTGGEYPARNPKQNIADLKAQAAANEKGVQQLYAMVDEFGRRMQPRRCAAPSTHSPIRASRWRWTAVGSSRWPSAAIASNAGRRWTSPARARSNPTTSMRRVR